MSRTNYFLQTLQHLRHYEEVLLFANLLQISEEEQAEAVVYLAKEYNAEAFNYPHQPPAFDEAAALWAAKTIYTAAQLLLYREHKEADLENLSPEYDRGITASAILSADLTLRFLPDVILQLKAIDADDALIPVLEKHLAVWHYSGIRYPLPVDGLQTDAIVSSPCLYQLYIDRIIAHKNLSLAQHPAFRNGVRASLGLYAPQFWSEAHQTLISNHEPD